MVEIAKQGSPVAMGALALSDCGDGDPGGKPLLQHKPGLFKVLEIQQQNLSEAYEPLRCALRDRQFLTVRQHYFKFRDELRRYLTSCSTQVFSYLVNRYSDDHRYEKQYVKTVLEANEMERFVQTVSMFFAFYNSPSVQFDASFDRRLASLIKVLNYRIHRMKAQVYPLLP